MKIIRHLTDSSILGIDSLPSQKPPRLTSRAIVKCKDGKYAVIYLAKFGCYTLPGGGIEAGESPASAVIREVLEETGFQLKRHLNSASYPKTAGGLTTHSFPIIISYP